eukprot:g3091.t1
MHMKIAALMGAMLLLCASAEAQWRCTFNYEVAPGSNCTRMSIQRIWLYSPFGQCFGGAQASIKARGNLHFPEGETLTAGDIQWRVYEDGVRSFIASGSADVMKHIQIRDDRAFEFELPFEMPKAQKTGRFTTTFTIKDQDKVYDLCEDLFFNYTRN